MPTTPANSMTIASLLREMDQSIDAGRGAMVSLRRRIHGAPEASGKEVLTTALAAQQLREAGLEARVMADGIGVIAEIEVHGGGEWVALRAELDCVGVEDDKTVEYASKIPGLCHACGHDAHTTMLLAAAAALARNRAALKGLGLRRNLRFIFQSAEETATGARRMIEQGALENVAAIVALHVDPTIEAGRIGLRKGAMTASATLFTITIRGRGGHSARPHEAVDPIPAATMLISQLYQLGPRSVDSRHPMSVTIGSIHAGQAANVIPDDAVISGTLRTTRMVDCEAVQERMKAIVEGVAKSTGCEIELRCSHFCPPTDNDPAVVDEVAAAARELLGDQGVHWIELPSMGGEDFAFYQERVPGAFVRLGAAMVDPKARRPLHSSTFDINEASLPVGAKLLARTAVRLAGR